MIVNEEWLDDHCSIVAPGSRIIPNRPDFIENPEDLPADTWTDRELEERLYAIDTASTELLIVMWKAIQAGSVSGNGQIGDRVLSLRDALSPGPDRLNWVPEALLRNSRYPEEFSDEALWTLESLRIVRRKTK
jgi:hypothetical protein